MTSRGGWDDVTLTSSTTSVLAGSRRRRAKASRRRPKATLLSSSSATVNSRTGQPRHHCAGTSTEPVRRPHNRTHKETP